MNASIATHPGRAHHADEPLFSQDVPSDGGSAKDAGLDGQLIRAEKLERLAGK